MEAPVFVKVFCAPFSIQDDFSLQFQWTELWPVGMSRIWGEVGRGPLNKQAGAALPVCLEREIEQCARLQLFAIHACTCW